jgi:hypothetical protein
VHQNSSTTVTSNTSVGPSKPKSPAVPAFTLERSETDELLYIFGSDDDSMLADFSTEAADIAELDTDPRSLSPSIHASFETTVSQSTGQCPPPNLIPRSDLLQPVIHSELPSDSYSELDNESEESEGLSDVTLRVTRRSCSSESSSWIVRPPAISNDFP